MSTAVIVLIALVATCLLLQLVALLRPKKDDALASQLANLRESNERLERTLRDEQRAGRGELAQAFEQFRGHVQQQMDAMGAQQRERIDGFGQRLAQLTERTDRGLETLRGGLTEDARKGREDSRASLSQFGEMLQQRLGTLSEHNEKRMAEVRGTLEAQLKALQADNAQQLEKMRATVDEKLQSTLETRLGQSFKLVSERLEAVQRGLGEMQSLATGVGDLKRVLTNVKTRGTFGEVQLGALLEQVLVAEQYAANVATVPGSAERVEFAIRLPGADRDSQVWLPIDAKFPREDYERLLDAQEAADAEAAGAAALALERRIRDEAKTIRGKYVAPPHTTDFAILFLPTEGLYAEVIRRPGLFELLQREHRVTLAGPTTLNALLNSLQMGFRTLAIEKRSSEVWELLGAVKTEFGKFGTVLEKTRKQLDTVRNSIDSAGVRTRAIERKLRGVESLSGDDASNLLGQALDDATPDTDDEAS
ncbi:DNA recombination protein RmuC [Oleiagrimonas sp. C23AA]|uniref:DNA recombination protein RmuC n=1 Tax=Oleiagrimonas sp. C23AA TaxID=2719047 RepID=UPI001421A034|nr:DNA recombination protein RmuC [Oleiagrimonas sp. C23AA]NII11310.1 DNA recombination protein RmuC [Oleiagrimonas sp. C23AA]